jgi:tetratricopeptide (TPR) repeat protein
MNERGSAMSEDFVKSRGLLKLGDKYIKQGNLEKAIHCYEQALESCPPDALSHHRIVSQRLLEAVTKFEKPRQRMPTQRAEPRTRTGDTITQTRYFANVVTNREIPAQMRPGLSQGLWGELKKEEPSLDTTSKTDVSPRAPCEFEFSSISCRDDVFIDTARQILAQWMRDKTDSMNAFFRGPFVCAGSVQMEWPSGDTRTIRYAVSLLAFDSDTAAKTTKKWWQFWK